MPRKPRTRSVAVALAALTTTGVLLGVAGTAVAGGGDGGTPSASAARTADGEGAGDGARALCKHAPKIDKRIERALHRLSAGAAKRGSIARLEKRVANAKAAGHDEIETYLNHKLTFRRSLVPTLEQRQKDLTEVRKWCRENRRESR
ncbi:hypothetical protein [Streptomyces sp. 7N604]|uniref:hypothetical protein n=1 Tax=Streptomyces sp. 7N604 TaxID=3457415 RepID=UPI003FD62CC4